MELKALEIPAVKLISPRKFGDHRGFFSETYSKRVLAEHGIALEFVQDNHSFSADAGTVRGLHCQIPPRAQAKLVRVTRGAIVDVAVDLRGGSPSFGKWVKATISAELWNQILVPVGFAHGFCTLEKNTEVIYKTSDYYAPDQERGIVWNDPDLAIEWPVSDNEAILVERDRAFPRFSQIERWFG